MKVRITAGVYEGMTGEVVEINFDNGMSRVQLDSSLTVSVRSQETEAIEDEVCDCCGEPIQSGEVIHLGYPFYMQVHAGECEESQWKALERENERERKAEAAWSQVAW